ncbi:MAG: hypothetical protein C5B49_05150 [Bdellovibrio sp.]|nr:MAG: hypothetical protein C5B49_05150 [Bdellovibrio sp.]
MELSEKKNRELKPLLVKLLQGFVTTENRKTWETLVLRQEEVRSYFRSLGLFLHFSREDGYAFLKTSPDEKLKPEADEDFFAGHPEGEADEAGDAENGDLSSISLVRKMPLPFDVSLLLVLLREALEQYDESVSDNYRLILKRADIHEMLKTFYPLPFSGGGDEIKILRRFDSIIMKVVGMGFLKELKKNSGVFEVRRVIKAFISASFLQEMKDEMAKFVKNKNKENQDVGEIP